MGRLCERDARIALVGAEQPILRIRFRPVHRIESLLGQLRVHYPDERTVAATVFLAICILRLEIDNFSVQLA